MPTTANERGEAQRSADAYLRRHGGFGSVSQNDLARYLYDNRSPNSTGQYLEFRNVAVQAWRQSQSAGTLQANPSLSILNLPTDPSIRGNQRQYAFHVVVAMNDASGREVQSTMVIVRSSDNLTGAEIHQIAIQQAQQASPMYPDQSVQFSRVGAGYTFEAYITLAGQRR